ncbi:efflux RND transporter periplasmic adaptor subunit [Halopseudomonas salina]|uniref:Macrolide transporter n=1 Tax=Halopseudomonas salina TaxID=1323744 RepID=A0ABQ1PLC0_9GAMM|nr:efflux RND transporter periplasmic adaptor subunit [Halopseudomonas salina]GGC98791.1 macrolide transporter [Halopseudomonas salina]
MQAGKSRSLPRLLLLVTTALAIAGALAWFLWFAPQSRSADYLTAEVLRGDIEESITALGTLGPLEYVDVGTQVSGQLLRLHVELGDRVEEGQLLAEIDPTLYLARVEASTAQLENLQAQLADREAQYTLARLQAERQQSLIELDATSQESVESAQATLRSAQAQIAAIKAQIRQTESTLRGDQADLDYTRIHAPMTGTVVQQLANQGQTLNANQTAPVVVQIADLSTMTVKTQVSEADISRLEVGMPAYFSTLGRPERRWEGILRQILPTPEVINNVVLFNALFDVSNSDGELLPQMSAQVFFVRDSAENVLTIPVAALGQAVPSSETSSDEAPQAQGKHYQVQVLDAQGQPQPRKIRIGTRTRIAVEVLAGLEEGEQVVTGGLPPTADGDTSRPSRRFM